MRLATRFDTWARLARRVSKKARLPRFERLEDRCVPTTTADVYSAGDFYRYDGAIVPLDRRSDIVSVQIDGSNPDKIVAGLISSDGPLNGFRILRQLEANQWMLHCPPSSPYGPNLEFSGDRDARLVQVAATIGVTWVAPVFQNPQSSSWMAVTDEVIVALEGGIDGASFFGGDRRFSTYRPLDGTPDQFVATLADDAGAATLTISEQLLADARVAWATPNFWQDWRRSYTPNDLMYSSQWHLNNSSNDADVDAPEAWNVIQGGSASVTIAIIDDGIELTHPDLQANIFVNPGEIGGNSKDDDGNGWVDDVNGWDFIYGDNNPGADSGADMHGTATAGVAAAVGNNAQGVAGIAFKSKILPVRIFDGGLSTNDANIASAIYYAAGRTKSGSGQWSAASLTSNSWGGGGTSSAITTAFTWATSNAKSGQGIPSFAATGNDSVGTIFYPASLSSSNTGVIAVGASTNFDERAVYSNYGSNMDLVAPSAGGSLSITTTDRTGGNGYSGTDYTDGFGGTSSATPLAAGTGALVLALAPTLTASQVRGLLRNTTDYIGPIAYGTTTGFNIEYGYGRINANTAVQGVGKAEIQLLDVSTNIADGSGTIDFGAISVGKSLSKTFRIRNQGTQTLNLSALSVSAPFSIASNFGSSSLAVGQTTTFTVSFAPSATGLVSKTLTFTSNDADEGSFDFTVRGTGQAPSLSGEVFQDNNANGKNDAGDAPIIGRLVYFDQNNSSALDNKNYTNNTVVSIPDNNPAGGSSTVSVSGMGTVTGIRLWVNISHTSVGQLALTLTGPTGKAIALSTNNGGTGNNYTSTIFDDSASKSITTGVAPFTGNFQPQDSLSGFRGLTSDGTWTLKVVDSGSGSIGTINNWTLNLFEQSTTSNASGEYLFDSLTTGNYRVREQVPGGWTETTPVVGSYLINYVAGQSYLDQDFGSYDVPVIPLDVTINQAAGQADPTFAASIHFTAVFSASVSDFATGDVAISGSAGATTAIVTGGGDTYDIAVSGMTQAGTVVVSIPAGVASNGSQPNNASTSTDNVVTFDATGPAATIGSQPSITVPTSAAYEFDVTFTDNFGIKTATIESGDIRITGPNSFDVPATLVGVDSSNNGPTRIATFSFDPPGGMWTNAHNGTYSIVMQSGAVTDTAGNAVQSGTLGTFNVAIPGNPPTVSSFKINDDGDPQRSQVRSIIVTFSDVVVLPASPVDAFSLFRLSPGTPNTFVDLAVDTITLSTPSQTIARITFSGALSENGGSLIDGRYDFTIDASKVSVGGVNLDGDGVGGAGGNFVRNLHRLFGDGDGNATVNSDDFSDFRGVFGLSGPSYFDNTADNNVGADDFAHFRQRFGLTV